MRTLELFAETSTFSTPDETRHAMGLLCPIKCLYTLRALIKDGAPRKSLSAGTITQQYCRPIV